MLSRFRLLQNGRRPEITGSEELLTLPSSERSPKPATVLWDRSKRQTLRRPPRRVLIVGAGHAGRVLAEELEEHFPVDYAIIGFVEDDPSVAHEIGDKVLGGREEIASLIPSHQIDEVMISDFLTGRLGGIACTVVDLNGPVATPAERPLSQNGPLPVHSSSQPSLYGRVKRGSDVLFALGALMLGAPLIAVVALAIKVTSRGPVFYCQERVGREGRPFVIYKLRTMVAGAEAETGPILARDGDPRSTRLGRVLRATKLDEWPQFYNVLRGDMSVVGPRPERSCFVQAYHRHIHSYSQRHTVRPGITGLAQVSGGYLTHVYVKLHYDLMYVSQQSFWLDMRILARTPVTILRNLKRAK